MTSPITLVFYVILAVIVYVVQMLLLRKSENTIPSLSIIMCFIPFSKLR